MNNNYNKVLSLLIIFTMLFTGLGMDSFGPITVNAEKTVAEAVYDKEKEKTVSEATYSCQTRLIEFMPAPGQYMQKGINGYGTIEKAKETLENTSKMVSLGAIGGSLVYGFDHTIENDQKNPYGVDFNVLGNAFFGWGEPGAIAVMKDTNGNGKADDAWYDIAGSAYYDKETIKDYEITYYNDGGVKWEDNQGASGKAPDKILYPKGEAFSFVPQDQYTIQCILINDKNPAYGYADVKGTKKGFSDYTKNPDNPYTPEVEGYGGASIDIDWAVDKNGKHVQLDGIDFVKISTAYREFEGSFGELSTEVRVVVDIAPDDSSEVKTIKVKDVEVTVGEKLPTEVILIQSNGAKAKKAAKWSKEASTKEKGTFIEQVIVDGQTYYTTLKVNGRSEERVTGVELKQKSLDIRIGREVKLNAEVKPANSANKKLIWKSNKNSIATVDAVGTVRGVSEGEAVITVETEDGGFTDSCTIKVTKLDVDAITSASLKEYKKAIPVGEKTKLEINFYPENAANKNVSWKSNNEAVVTIKDGYIVANNPGEATITMTTEDGGFVDVCKIVVKKEFKKIKLRVEGIDQTLCEKELEVTDEKTALDLLKTGVGEKFINTEGGRIYTIRGETPNWAKDKAYWGIYILKNGKTSLASEGATTLKIDDLDEVLFHVTQSQKTGLPALEYKNDGNDKKIILKATTYDEKFNPIIKTVERATLEIKGKTYITDHNGEAAIDLPLGRYNTKIYKKDQDGKFVELIRCTQNFKVGNIKILGDSDLFAVGDTIKLGAKVFDGSEEIKGKTIKWYTNNAEVATVDENTGVVKTIKEGVVTITAKLEGASDVNESIQLTVQKNISNKRIIENTVNDLRKYYKNDKEFDIIEALSYKHTNSKSAEDLKTIQEKYKVTDTPKTAAEYAHAIMGLIALGENPRDYKGKDFVDGLVQLQNKDGKFILGKYDDYPTVSAISIIALDRAKANYRVEDAVKALMSYQNEDGTFGPYKDMDTLAMSLKGLYNHKDIVGVDKCIDKAVQKLLAEKKNIIKGNANTLGAVMQGLISVGENPLTSKWTVDGKTMLNSLFKYKDGDTFGNYLATEQVFAVLADLQRKESMYTGATINNDGYDELFVPVKEENTGETQIEEGDKATICVKGTNNQYVVAKKEIKLESGDTVYSVIIRILKNEGISYEEEDGYFKMIEGLREFDKGAKSGWMYNVNGVTVSENPKNCNVHKGDRIEWFYTVDYTSDSRNTGGTGGAAPATTETNYKDATKVNENKLDEAIKKTGKAKLDIKESKDGKGYLPTKKIADLAKKDKALTIESKGVQLTFGVQSLMTEKLNKALKAKNTTIAIGAKEVEEKEKKEIIKKAAIGKSTELFEIGGKIVDLSVQVLHVDDKGKATKEEKIDQFNEPVKVTIDLSDAKLSKDDIKNLTGIRYEKDKKGNITPKKLGGTYDSKTKMFTFYTDQFSLYGVLKAKDLVKINLEIDEKNIMVNDEGKLMDVSPMITNNRTMVPVRFIAENMGADVKWIGETKTVKILLGDKKLSLVIDEKVDGLDAPATIVKDRTFVPLRYVSEYFDANVLWYPSSKKVEIVK